ncbi:MAG: hypothetical protein O7F75_05550 [Alphaproteobacteria bacterium]|jgi:hypothetical protein|nr:hypothetical protein [Alphaproteobacteria bacterium]
MKKPPRWLAPSATGISKGQTQNIITYDRLNQPLLLLHLTESGSDLLRKTVTIVIKHAV